MVLHGRRYLAQLYLHVSEKKSCPVGRLLHLFAHHYRAHSMDLLHLSYVSKSFATFTKAS